MPTIEHPQSPTNTTSPRPDSRLSQNPPESYKHSRGTVAETSPRPVRRLSQKPSENHTHMQQVAWRLLEVRIGVSQC